MLLSAFGLRWIALVLPRSWISGPTALHSLAIYPISVWKLCLALDIFHAILLPAGAQKLRDVYDDVPGLHMTKLQIR